MTYVPVPGAPFDGYFRGDPHRFSLRGVPGARVVVVTSRFAYLGEDRNGNKIFGDDTGETLVVTMTVADGGRLYLDASDEVEPLPWAEMLLSIPRHAWATAVAATGTQYRSEVMAARESVEAGKRVPDPARIEGALLAARAAALLSARSTSDPLLVTLLLDGVGILDAYARADAVAALDRPGPPGAGADSGPVTQ